MKILYLSVLTSSEVLDDAQRRNPHFVSHAVHKFNRLIVEGLSINNVEVTTLSTFYLSNRRTWHHKKEKIQGILYHYIPCLNIPFVRQLWLTFYCFFFVLGWGLFHRKQKALVCDALNVSACSGAVTAARLLRLRRVGVVTDMPGLMVGRDASKSLGMNLLKKMSANNNKRYLDKFTHYVFLTEQMNEVINIHRKPYLVMEGLVNQEHQTIHRDKTIPRTIFYAGGLHVRYGLRMLVDAVKLLPQQDIQLVIYGDGPFVEDLKKERDSRVVYRGIVSNEMIVEEEQRATLLVNPRPTNEEFTKYSFPSKNMEYMLSGTPLLTTCLPGMPQEYYPYVFIFDEETTEGYYRKLNDVLSLTQSDLNARGESAKRFVLTKKNNIVQAGRILELLNQNS